MTATVILAWALVVIVFSLEKGTAAWGRRAEVKALPVFLRKLPMHESFTNLVVHPQVACGTAFGCSAGLLDPVRMGTTDGARSGADRRRLTSAGLDPTRTVHGRGPIDSAEPITLMF